jgi:hypothetical protein
MFDAEAAPTIHTRYEPIHQSYPWIRTLLTQFLVQWHRATYQKSLDTVTPYNCLSTRHESWYCQ